MERNILLSTLGMSAMIVPQAFGASETSFDEVHVFTTDNKDSESLYKVLQPFFRKQNILFTFTVAKGIILPHTTDLNHRFEESLFQWYLEKSEGELPYVCLSGGTKTIPAIMQKAAQLFGAKEVFHVISNTNFGAPPKTIQEVNDAIKIGQIQVVHFGPEEGWAAFRNMKPNPRFSVTERIKENFFKKETQTDFPLTTELKEIQHNIKTFFTTFRSPILPFSNLLMLPSRKLDWLNQPLQQSDKNWLLALPKTELHCHLGGFATQAPLLNKVRERADFPDELKPVKAIPYPEGWPVSDETTPLNKYMQLGDNTGSYILSDPGCLKAQIEWLYKNLQDQHVKYAEIRCSPYNYTRFISATEVLELITNTFQRLMDASDDTSRCHVNLIIIVSRKDEGDLSSISKHLALAITATSNSRNSFEKCRVVGVDLAGYETKSTRASYFQHDFIGVHRCGLAVTAHAGENDDVEGIWQAVYQLNARRIGHALHLYQSEDLMHVFADRQIAVEMCPYANYQIKGFYPMKGKGKYPLLKYLSAGIPVSVNTDNIGISNASITDNFLLLAKMLPEISRMNVLQLIRNGITSSFQQEHEKQALLASCEKRILQICQGIES